MKLSRRSFVSGMVAASGGLLRGKAGLAFVQTPTSSPVGRLPFSRFTDVAREAGLTAPTIYGGFEHDIYINESVGGGCAFFDYDNDSWMDIFVLGGSRLEGPPPGATNRLYKNKRDGTFTDVTEKAGL